MNKEQSQPRHEKNNQEQRLVQYIYIISEAFLFFFNWEWLFYRTFLSEREWNKNEKYSSAHFLFSFLTVKIRVWAWVWVKFGVSLKLFITPDDPDYG